MPLASPAPSLLAWALVAGLAAPTLADEYASADFGFRLQLPDGWVTTEERATSDGLEVAWAPLDAATSVQLKIRVNPTGVGRDPDLAVTRILDSVRGDDAYAGAERTRRELLGARAPGLQIDSSDGQRTWRVRQAFAAQHGLLYQLQDITVPDEFDARVEGFDAIWETFAFTELSAESVARRRLESLAARCGSEVGWARNWDDAVRRARAGGGLPILASLRRYPGFDISDERMSGFFMNEDTLALLEERFVPLLVDPAMQVPFADHDVYGMSSYSFGEALLVVDTGGEVHYDHFLHVDALLVDALSGRPDWAGPPAARLRDPLDQARLHFRRGELPACLASLDEVDESAPARALAVAILRAEVAARRSDAPGAWDALQTAREHVAALEPEEADARDAELDLLIAEAGVLSGLGRGADAAERVERALALAEGGAREAEVVLMAGDLAWAREGQDAARGWYERLVLDEERADERWTWLAAARLTSTGWLLDESGGQEPGPTGWPDAADLALLAPPRFDPLPVSDAARAADDALAYLLALQRPDGHWPSRSDVSRADDDPADDFQLAITAIAIQGLLTRRGEPGVDAAVQRAVAWLLPAYEGAVEADEPDAFMDYAVWSRPYVLWALADLVDHGLLPGGRARDVAASIHAELSALQKPGGGWSYYLTGDIESAPPTVLVSMTFTTAVNVLALVRAREAGLAPPEELIERGLDSLQAALTDDGLYVYMVGAEASRPTGPSGASGRGPLCAWAMLAGGRGDGDAIEEALEAFMRHREAYARETGKALMHTGLQAEGSHWLLFDYTYAAAAADQLPARKARRFERPLLELLLATRTEDGAFVDNPIIGPAYGAGMALMAFEHLLGGR